MKVVGEENENGRKPVKLDELSIEQLKELIVKQDEYIKQLQLDGMFKRLDYLIEILHLSDKFSEKFVDYCSKEVENLIVIDKEAYGVQ